MIYPDMNYKDCDTLLKDKTKWTQDYDEYPCCKTCINFDFLSAAMNAVIAFME
jgi:hypothetical protein